MNNPINPIKSNIQNPKKLKTQKNKQHILMTDKYHIQSKFTHAMLGFALIISLTLVWIGRAPKTITASYPPPSPERDCVIYDTNISHDISHFSRENFSIITWEMRNSQWEMRNSQSLTNQLRISHFSFISHEKYVRNIMRNEKYYENFCEKWEIFYL